MYATCSVEYDGRASSILNKGNYLIMYKNDRSFSIHANDLNIPRNYMGCGTNISYEDNIITANNKKESIKIYLDTVIHFNVLNNWSHEKTVVYKTEKQLVDKLYDNISNYVVGDIVNVVREFSTSYGPVDLVVITSDGVHHVFEVKRKKATVSNVTQLMKYNGWFVDNNLDNVSYLVAPTIADNALSYLHKHSFKYISIDFSVSQ